MGQRPGDLGVSVEALRTELWNQHFYNLHL